MIFQIYQYLVKKRKNILINKFLKKFTIMLKNINNKKEKIVKLIKIIKHRVKNKQKKKLINKQLQNWIILKNWIKYHTTLFLIAWISMKNYNKIKIMIKYFIN